MVSKLLLALTLLPLMAVAKPKPAAKPAAKIAKSNLLDTTAIHQLYLDGDFDEAIDKIETARLYGGPFNHDDSVFIFKHLGVMYTAKYETREKGKQHMMLLLQAEPTARIMDMYASDMIYMIFKNIKDEFDMSQAKMKNANKQLHGGQPEPEPEPTPKGKQAKSGDSEKSMSWIGWTAGALAAAGGVALYIHMNEEEAKPIKQGNVVP